MCEGDRGRHLSTLGRQILITAEEASGWVGSQGTVDIQTPMVAECFVSLHDIMILLYTFLQHEKVIQFGHSLHKSKRVLSLAV